MRQSHEATEAHRREITSALLKCGIITESTSFVIKTKAGDFPVDLSAARPGSIIHEIARQVYEKGIADGGWFVQSAMQRALGLKP